MVSSRWSDVGLRCLSAVTFLVLWQAAAQAAASPLLPGPVTVAAVKEPEKMRRALEQMIPLGRLGTPEELAAMAVYLASDEARFVTGAEFVFDGGFTAN